MHFSLSFILWTLFAVSAVLAHRPLRPGVASHHGEHRRPLKHRQAADADVVYGGSMAGAILDLGDYSQKTFSYATGTFAAPNISGDKGSSASAWIGIDSENGPGPFQAGIDFVITEEGQQYNAWFEWYPVEETIYPDPNIKISAGDRIRVTLVLPNGTSGIAMIENLSSDQHVSQILVNPSTPMMRQRAEWLVEDYADEGGSSTSLANFGTVTFTHCLTATTEGKSYTPADADIYEIVKSGQVVTSVFINGSSVTVQHV